MFYDLNVPWRIDDQETHKTVAFLRELGYNVVALSYLLSGKLPADLSSPIPDSSTYLNDLGVRVLRRCTLVLSDPAQNHRIASLSSAYDLLALRPTTEKCLQQACQSLDCDLISLDLTQRLGFHFKFKMLSAAIERGIRFEICYAPGILSSDPAARRNLISNATQLIRATRGRGLVISSEAKKALGCRGPWDTINLAAVWGLGQEKGYEAVTKEARSVVVTAQMKRLSYRGAVEVIQLEQRIAKAGKREQKEAEIGRKRNATEMINESKNGAENAKPISKREIMRQAKKARFEALEKQKETNTVSTSELVDHG